jgi:hypothetical protein
LQFDDDGSFAWFYHRETLVSASTMPSNILSKTTDLPGT